MAKDKASYDCIVIGGGASGMMAAISAARAGGKVLIVEHESKLGKKLLATGNGKCNFTNAKMNESCYRGDRRFFSILQKFSEKDTLSFFHEIGIYPKEKNGYYYPNSEQAVSVVDALIRELKKLHVELTTGTKITDIKQKGKTFRIATAETIYISKTVIFAVGLLASPKLGSDGSAFDFIKNFGHHFNPIVPALCGFYAKGADFKKIAGVRTSSSVKILCDGKIISKDSGELQLTDYGISGIPVFQVSRYAAYALKDNRKVEASVCFLPGMKSEELIDEWNYRISRNAGAVSVYDLLDGLFNQKLIGELIRKAGMTEKDVVTMHSNEQMNALAKVIMDFRVTLTKVRDYEFAQVCAGGISADDLDVNTLMSQLVPGLFFCGEILDVDGICGGYNLQWAWSSGFVAGDSAITYSRRS